MKLFLSALATLPLLASALVLDTRAEEEIANVSRFECGTDQSKASLALLKAHSSLANDKNLGAPGARAMRRFLRTRDVITIPTVFHIVTSAAKAEKITK